MSGKSLESDLRDAREARGLSLEDIQAETRIPVHILRQFEDGGLVGDPTYNEVYLRAFLKSYAKSVGLSQTEVLETYDQSRGRSAPAPPPAPTPPVSPDTEPPALPPVGESPGDSGPKAPRAAALAGSPAEAVSAETARPEGGPAAASKTSRPPAVAAASGDREGSTAAPSAPGARVRRPPVPGARRSFDKNWGTIIGLFVAVMAVLGGALWFFVFRDAGEPGASLVRAEDSTGAAAAIDSVGVGAGSGSNAPQLQVPISVTLYAGGDGLQNFRVTEEPGDRRPYWIDAGDSETFTSPEAIVLWGEGGDGFGDDAVVELQGQRWTPSGTAPVRIDAASGQRLLDSLAARPAGSVPALPSAPAAPAAE